MADYIFPENPEYITAIRQLESTDPANAALFNDLFEKLIQNTHAVKLETDNKSDLGHTHLPGDCGLGKNLTFTGAVTGTYNGQAAKTVLIPDQKGCRFIVGTSTNGWTAKDCDYLCDGTDDQVEINAAINALPSTGGEVVILAGTYNFTGIINIQKEKVVLSGNGACTVLKKAKYIDYIIRIYKSYCRIENMKLDENSRGGGLIETLGISTSVLLDIEIISCAFTNVTGYGYAINFSSVNTGNIIKNIMRTTRGGGNRAVYVTNCNEILISQNVIYDFCYGIVLSDKSFRCMITENKILRAASFGINTTNVHIVANNYIASVGEEGDNGVSTAISCNYHCIVMGNIVQGFGLSNYGISVRGNSAISGNYISDCTISGIWLPSGGDSAVTGNHLLDNVKGIQIASSRNAVTGNSIFKSDSYGSSEYSISITSGSYNLISDNLIYGKNYTASGGTGNTFVNNKYN